jgi:hypothetical protein
MLRLLIGTDIPNAEVRPKLSTNGRGTSGIAIPVLARPVLVNSRYRALKLAGTAAYKGPGATTGAVSRTTLYPSATPTHALTMTQTTTPKHYTRIVLAERPEANITPTTFRKETVSFDLKPGPGEILMRVDWISLDPALRTWLRDVRSYVRPVQIGEVMRCVGLCTVVEAGEGCELRPGDIVCTRSGESAVRPCSVLFASYIYLAGR